MGHIGFFLSFIRNCLISNNVLRYLDIIWQIPTFASIMMNRIFFSNCLISFPISLLILSKSCDRGCAYATQEVEKMSNKLFSCAMQLCKTTFPWVCEWVSLCVCVLRRKCPKKVVFIISTTNLRLTIANGKKTST